MTWTPPVEAQGTTTATGVDAARLQRRAANYLAAAMIYLRDNVDLAEPLRPEHIKPRVLGHWGTCPGLNLICAGLHRVIRRDGRRTLLVTGPGHGAPAILANLWLEGTLGEVTPGYGHGREGMAELIRSFSWPGGFPSHLNPWLPGVLHEGGELGYALATAAGTVLDDPDLLTVCVIGDGEAETGPTAGSWLTNRFLDPVTSGALLPIVHLNGYKIANPSLLAGLTDSELSSTFRGLGWRPQVVDVRQERGVDPDASMARAFDHALAIIDDVQGRARHGGPRLGTHWPLILLRSDKGWTGVDRVDGQQVVGTWRAHQVPIGDVAEDPDHLALLEGWLRSYRPEELFEDGIPVAAVREAMPDGDLRLGAGDLARGGVRRPLVLPDPAPQGVDVAAPGRVDASATHTLGRWLGEVVRAQGDQRHFRVVCPDELASNRLDPILDATPRGLAWPVDGEVDRSAPDGMVMEVLSEHLCQGWLQGYLLTGRHGLFPCYEAFVSIVDSMVNQYAKFLKVAKEVPWREPVPSLTYLLTSEGWRQEHNGYSHQGPGFLDAMLDKKASLARIYLPPDANTLLATMRHCLAGTDRINVVVAGKHQAPLWLDLAAAQDHLAAGASHWAWASTDGDAVPDVILAAAGDVPTVEALAAAWLLRRDVPDLRVRAVNVIDLFVLQHPDHHSHGLSEERFEELFGATTEVVFAFHGYPTAVHQLLHHRPAPSRFHVHGYQEEGTTTTPFALLVANGASRYDLALDALDRSGSRAAGADAAAVRYREGRDGHDAYIREHGIDPPEVTEWRWT